MLGLWLFGNEGQYWSDCYGSLLRESLMLRWRVTVASMVIVEGDFYWYGYSGRFSWANEGVRWLVFTKREQW